MADENDPDRPEDDPPGKPPEGGEPAAPEGSDENELSADPEQPPAEPEQPQDETVVHETQATEPSVEEHVQAADKPTEDDALSSEPEAPEEHVEAAAPAEPDVPPYSAETTEPPADEPVETPDQEYIAAEEAPPDDEPAHTAEPEDAPPEDVQNAVPADPPDEHDLFEEPEAPRDPLEDTVEVSTPTPEEESLPIAAREQIQAPDNITHMREDAPAGPPEELPANYFRAAGDPDEGEAEAPPSQFGRLSARVEQTARDTWAAIEPGWVKFRGLMQGGLVEAWRRIRGVKGPRSVREAAVWGGYATGAFVALIVGFFFFITWGLPSTDDLWEARNGQSITFLDRNGNVILREGAQNAPPVDLATLPPYVSQAFVSIEDRRFYDHFGIDIGGMMRAAAENIRSGRVVQGGSTITQQLAKNLFLTNERSWRRKAQEVAMAIWLETRFTKDEILALYLSRVYFGAGSYGIEAASERYFDRPARELTLLQAATLAGLVKAPSRMNPARQDITAARDRAEIVLNEMVGMGFISDTERQAALQDELIVSRRNPAGVLGYFRDWIDPLLNEVIGQQRDDFIVETTLDISSQRAGAQAVEEVLAQQGEERRVGQAALLAMDDEGGVRAMVGGRDYDISQFNRATQARRQPGSSFKYFIYLAAMENGLTPYSVREDAPITVYIDGQPPWTPGNYTNEFHGPVTLTSAFANSFNMVAIRVANEVGGDKVIAVAQRLGVRSQLHNYHSLALGAQEVTLMEMTQAYGAMASEGFSVEAHGVARIRRANNNETMWGWRQENRTRVIEERPLRYMNYMMSRVVQAGTGTRARMELHQIAGKTGTGNDYRDAWFIGFTPGYVAGVWVGNDNFTTTARVTGGSLPAEIWARYMTIALQNVPARDLQMPGPDDYDEGVPVPEMPTMTAVGAPIGVLDAPAMPPPDGQDRSLDFGPEG